MGYQDMEHTAFVLVDLKPVVREETSGTITVSFRTPCGDDIRISMASGGGWLRQIDLAKMFTLTLRQEDVPV